MRGHAGARRPGMPPALHFSPPRRRPFAAKTAGRPRTARDPRSMNSSMRRRRVRKSLRQARRPAAPSRAARRSKDGAPLSPSGTLAEVLKFQAKSTAALRAVKMPMAVEPSFVFKP